MAAIPLSDLAIGQQGTIEQIEGSDTIVQRLLEMGLTEGETVEVVTLAPLGDPLDIRIRGYQLSLRRTEAQRVLVNPL